MRETKTTQVLVPALGGVNQARTDQLPQFATLQNVLPLEVGAHSRAFGKKLSGVSDGPVLSIHQLWSAYGYSQAIQQETTGLVSLTLDAPDLSIRFPLLDYPLA